MFVRLADVAIRAGTDPELIQKIIDIHSGNYRSSH